MSKNTIEINQQKSLDYILNLLYTKQIKPDYQIPFYTTSLSNEKFIEALSISKPVSKSNKKPNYIDIGCGDGFSLILANQVGYNIYGIDNSEPVLNLAKNNLKQYNINPNYVSKGDIFNPKDYPTDIDNLDVFFTFQKIGVLDKYIQFFQKNVKPNSRLISITPRKYKKQSYLNKYHPNLDLFHATDEYTILKKT
jgi:SAM-dependent methyltransferase